MRDHLVCLLVCAALTACWSDPITPAIYKQAETLCAANGGLSFVTIDRIAISSRDNPAGQVDVQCVNGAWFTWRQLRGLK